MSTQLCAPRTFGFLWSLPLGRGGAVLVQLPVSSCCELTCKTLNINLYMGFEIGCQTVTNLFPWFSRLLHG